MVLDWLKQSMTRLKFILSNLYRLVYAGIPHTQCIQESRQVLITNILLILYIILSVPFVCLFCWKGLKELSYITQFIINGAIYMSFAFSMYLNKQGKQPIAAMLLVLVVQVVLLM